MPDPFQIFVKPVGASCNLACGYCYYLPKTNMYHSPLLMNDTILESYIRQHIDAASDDPLMFSWHGGEPLLAGIEFYKKAVTLQKQFGRGRPILNGMQTNGTLLNDEWCRFFSNENFTIGISLDGPAGMHDMFRKTPAGGSSFNGVMRGYRLLRQHAITTEILCVVNSYNAMHPGVVYDFFRKAGAEYITFLPLVERVPGGVSEKSVPPAAFGSFLSTIFDMWVEEDIGKIKVQVFEEAARAAFSQDHTLCIFKRDCGGVPVLEHNGDMYACDHFADSEHFLGNIGNTPVASLLGSRIQLDFGKAKSGTLPRYCVYCEYRSMCNGECPKNRFINAPDGEPGLNYLCEGYRQFFAHCKPFVEAIAEAWKKS